MSNTTRQRFNLSAQHLDLLQNVPQDQYLQLEAIDGVALIHPDVRGLVIEDIAPTLPDGVTGLREWHVTVWGAKGRMFSVGVSDDDTLLTFSYLAPDDEYLNITKEGTPHSAT